MLLTIGKVAQFFGLSSETLRVYEKNGIISPSRRSESQYREFTAWDIFDLNECVGYRGMNLSLKEIRMVTKEGTSDDLTALLEKKENELRAQVGRERELCEFIREYRERVEMAPYNLNHFWFGKEPAYKYIVSFKNKDGIYTGLETALAHVKESGLELDGQIVGELILRAYQGGEPHRYLNIMIPVKEKTEIEVPA